MKKKVLQIQVIIQVVIQAIIQVQINPNPNTCKRVAQTTMLLIRLFTGHNSYNFFNFFFIIY